MLPKALKMADFGRKRKVGYGEDRKGMLPFAVPMLSSAFDPTAPSMDPWSFRKPTSMRHAGPRLLARKIIQVLRRELPELTGRD